MCRQWNTGPIAVAFSHYTSENSLQVRVLSDGESVRYMDTGQAFGGESGVEAVRRQAKVDPRPSGRR